MGAITTEAVLTPVKLLDSNEGGQGVLDIRDYKGPCDFVMFAKSDAGSSPTCDLKLQSSDLSYSDLSYQVSDSEATEDVELREGATTNVKIAAKIETDGAIQVGSVVLMLKKNGTVSETDLTLTIEGDSAGDPDGSAVGTATVSTDDVGASYAGVEFTFDTPVELSASTTYWLVLASDYTESATNNVAWQTESGLSSGGNQSLNDGTNWTADADDSQVLVLREYAFADVTGGAYTQATTTGSIQRLKLDAGNMKRYVRAHSTIGGTSTPAFYAGISITGFKE